MDFIAYTSTGAIIYSHEKSYGLTPFEYQTIHVPSGKVLRNIVHCENKDKFANLLTHWDIRGADQWKYWQYRG